MVRVPGAVKRRFSKAILLIVFSGWAAIAAAQTASPTQAPTRPVNSGPGGLNEAPGAIPSRRISPQVEKLFNDSIEAIRASDFSGAAALLRKAVALAPQDATLHHYLGYSLWRVDKLDAARTELTEAHRLDPANSYTVYFLAIIAYSQGDLKGAVSRFESLVESGRPVNDTYRRLSLAYEDQGNLGKAEAAAQQALQHAPWDGSLHYLLANIYQKMGRSAEAKAEFETSTRLKSLGHDAIQELLELSEAIQARQPEKTTELREQLLGQAANNPVLLKTLGVLLARGHLFSEALEPFQMAADLEPQSFEAQFNLGLTLARLGQDSQAETCIRKALAIQPDLFEANSTLAALLINQGRSQEAIERLEAARQVSPDNVNVLVLLGQQYLAVRQFDKSIQALEAARRLKPDSAGIRYLLIEAYYQAEEFPQALAAAEAAEKAIPLDARLCYETGFQLAAVGRYAEAAERARKAIRMDPSLVPAYDLLGKIQLHDGDAPSALATYQKAKNLGPQDVQAWVGIGQSLTQLQRYPEALAELQEAQKAHPDSADVYYALAQVYLRLGNKQEAERASDMFKRLHVNE